MELLPGKESANFALWKVNVRREKSRLQRESDYKNNIYDLLEE